MAASGHEPFSIGDDGATLLVRVTPKASRSGFAGLVTLPDGRCALSVRVAAPPVDGAANAALVALLGKQLGVGGSGVAIVSGEASRLKVVRILGDGQGIAERLRQTVGPLGAVGQRSAVRSPAEPT